MRETTEIRINEHGDETHESWLLIRASKPTGYVRLFDSELNHQHFVAVTISECTRKRDLSNDWLHASREIMEIRMSMAQWGAFVSSFGEGSGVPATLAYDYRAETPMIPSFPHESRLAVSHAEVKEAGDKALEEIQEAHAAVQEAFERNAGKKEMRALLRTLEIRMGNAPSNMRFVAEQLTEHTEKVVVKARADIESMVAMAQSGGIEALMGGSEAPAVLDAVVVEDPA